MTAPAQGTAVPPREVSITRETLVRYAGAADDYVQQHWNHPFMIESGFPDVVVHGWLTFAHMCRAVTDWLPGAEWRIAHFTVRYLRPTYPGMLTCGGEVAEVGDDGATLTLWAKDAEGMSTTAATVRMARVSG